MQVDKNKEYQFEKEQFLYKYMDIHRLIYFITTGKLFFSPLSYFDDPLEGISEKLLFSERVLKEEGKEQLEEKTIDTHHLQLVQRSLYASCWFLDNRESQAMWETYSNRDSVALRFDPQHLCNVMIQKFKKIDAPGFTTMVHGKVEYFKLSPFDATDISIKKCGHRYSGFLKDISYKHEEEFRFLLMRQHDSSDPEYFEFCPGPLDELEFTVISHPNMEEWKFNNICNILKTANLQDRLEHSKIPTRRLLFQQN